MVYLGFYRNVTYGDRCRDRGDRFGSLDFPALPRPADQPRPSALRQLSAWLGAGSAAGPFAYICVKNLLCRCRAGSPVSRRICGACLSRSEEDFNANVRKWARTKRAFRAKLQLRLVPGVFPTSRCARSSASRLDSTRGVVALKSPMFGCGRRLRCETLCALGETLCPMAACFFTCCAMPGPVGHQSI